LKFDYETITNRENEILKDLIKRILKNSADDLLLVCGSTKPGEEELLLLAFENLRRDFDHLKLIIAPRHPHRGDEVTELVKDTGFSYLQRSRNEFGEKNEGSTDILILDSIGELASLYEIADLVFIGGSLVPAGGQNVIEPAAYGKPILFGPHMENFRQVAAAFVEAGAAIRVENGTELETQLHTIISAPGERYRLGEKARSVVKMNRGAVKQTLRVVEKYLPQQNKN
jgi:3-deoxy-D-manno-octulosonic-acid transferase